VVVRLLLNNVTEVSCQSDNEKQPRKATAADTDLEECGRNVGHRMTKIERSLRSATSADVSEVASLVDAAYGHYVERIGMLPRPMTDDYAEVIRNRRVMVAESHGTIVGVLVLTVTDEGFLIDNVAVAPDHRGTGLGRALLEFAEAEARRAGFDSIYLYTHEKMSENLALYSRIGYIEYDRRSQGDFSLVFMRKHLG
jgi:GNAT superfamily N-acetyltransferase